jgi:general secretion pathway protein D
VLIIVPFYNENKIYFLSTSGEMLSEAGRLIGEIDRPSKQVMIQGQVIEFTVGDGFNSIFDFQLRDSKLVPTSPNPQSVISAGNLRYSFLDSQLVANIDIAKNEGRATYVSSPMLLTMNRVSANLDLTEEVSIITGVKEGSVTTYDSGTVVVPPIPIYETKKLGTQLAITPFINSADEILLKIEVNIASLSGNTQTIQVPTATGNTEKFTFDSVSESKIDTVLSTANKKTIVIGGLIRDTISTKDTKTPILGDIPLLGIPFKKTEESTQKKELIIILTPTIVDLKNPRGEENIRDARRHFDGYQKIDRFTSGSGRNAVHQKHSVYDSEIKEFLEE